MEEEDQGYSPNPNPMAVERGFRKLYWQCGLKALAGVGVLALVGRLGFPSKWWYLPFILVGGGLVLYNLQAIAMLSKAQHRYREGPEDDTPLKFQDRAERAVHVMSYVILGVVLLIGGAGVAIAAFVLWWIKRSVPGYYQRNSEARAGAILGLFFSLVAITVLGSAWIDRSSAKARAEVVRFAVEDAGTNIKSGSNYVHVFHPGQAETTFRIQVRGKELEPIAGRDSVDLRIGTGDLGFAHVLGVTSRE
jgi:cytochrome b561